MFTCHRVQRLIVLAMGLALYLPVVASKPPAAAFPAAPGPTANHFAFALGATRPVGELYWPEGIALGPDGSVYVADSGNHRVQRFLPDGTFSGTWGRLGSDQGQFERPSAIGVGPDGAVFVADAQRGRMQRFGAGGAFQGMWPEEGYRALKGIEVNRDGTVWVVHEGGFIEHRAADGMPIGSFQALRHPGDIVSGYAGGLALAPDGSLYISDWMHDRVERYSAEGQFLDMWGTEGSGPGQLASPYGLAVAADGTVYVADSGNRRVQRFSPDGKFLSQWGSFGSGIGRFGRTYEAGPVDLEIAADGSVYVLDPGNGRVQHFTATGSYIRHWGTPDSGSGQFYRATGVATAPDGTLFVADSGNHRIQHLTADGRFLGTWGSQGAAPGLFGGASCFIEPCGPHDVAVSPDGKSVYVTDPEVTRVQRFAPDGTVIGQWGALGTDPGQFGGKYGGLERIAVAPDGTVLITDPYNARVQRFTAEGGFLNMWGSKGDGPGQFQSLSGIAVAPDGTVFTADGHTARVQTFSLQGNFIATWLAGTARESDLNDLTVTGDGRVCVVDGLRARVRCYTVDGQLLMERGLPGYGDGQLVMPADLAVTPDGTLNVVDYARNGLQRFARVTQFGRARLAGDSQLVTSFGLGQFDRPGSLTVGPDGTLYVADGLSRIQRFRADGLFLGTWGARGYRDGEGQFLGEIGGLAVAPDGTLYAMDRLRVQHFDATGRFLGQWELADPADPDLDFAHIAVAPDGTLYIAGGTTVQHYRPDGQLLAVWGGIGTTLGKFYPIAGVAVGLDGTVFVADPGNNRIQRFTQAGAPLRAWQPGGCADSSESFAQGITVASDGTLYVADNGHCILRLAPDGRILARWGEWGFGESQFYWPKGLAAAPDGTLYVSDSGNQRVQVFATDVASAWRVELYPNRWLVERPLAVWSAGAIDFVWGAGAPDPALPADGFSMRIERTWRLAAGIHRFGIDAAGGVRLWVDSRLLVDAWDGPAVARMVELDLAAGEHRVRLEFNDPGGAASLRAGWTTIPETPTSSSTPTPPIPTATPRPGTRAFLPRLARNSLR